MPWRAALYPRLTPALAAALRALAPADAAALEEIRVYAGREAALVAGGRTRRLGVRTDDAQMEALLAALCGQALYSCERQLAEGYLPLPGGHRAGVCGRMARGPDGAWRLGRATSVCIRICRSVPGASEAIRPYLLDGGGAARRVLLLGPPGCGKTTVLRDAALYLSGERGLHVAVADEREELFAAAGAPAGSLDVLGGMDKARAMTLLLRAMAPQVIVTDEIGGAGDAAALLDAARCGVGVLASAHAGSLADALRRPALHRWMDMRAFDGYVLLGRRGSVRAVYDESGRERKEDGDGQLGCGGDGDDWDQCDGLSDLGRGKVPCAVDPRDAALSAADERRHPV